MDPISASTQPRFTCSREITQSDLTTMGPRSLSLDQAQQILKYWCTGLEEGITEILFLTGDVSIIHDFAHGAEDILAALATRGNHTAIKIQTTNFLCSIEEINGSCLMTLAGEIRRLDDLTLTRLEHNLLIDIFSYPDTYQFKPVTYALNHILIDAKDSISPELIQYAVDFLLSNPTCFVSKELTFAAADIIFRQNHPANSKYFAQFVIQSANHCESRSVIGATKYIFSHEDHFLPVLTKSAAIIIVNCVDCFSEEFIQLAIKNIVDYAHEYAEHIISQAALAFIHITRSFFTMPHADQEKFVNIFTSMNAIDVLEDYSQKLTDALGTKSRLHAWKKGKFKELVRKHPAIGLFILNNRDHEAITLWGIYSVFFAKP